MINNINLKKEFNKEINRILDNFNNKSIIINDNNYKFKR